MTLAQDATNELQGISATDHHATVLYEGSEYAVTVRSVQAKIGRLAWDLLRFTDAYDVGRDDNRDGVDDTRKPAGLLDLVRRIAFEVTLWLPIRTPTELATRRGRRGTIRDHTVDAASLGYANADTLARIEVKLDELLANGK